MNIFLWILQVLLALHTIMGALWKFSNSAQTVPSLKIIPHGVWLALAVVEILCGLGLILPVFSKRLGIAVPVAATLIAVEMMLFSGIDLFSGNIDYNHIIYWLVVAAVSVFVAYGRFVLKPIHF